MRPVPAAACEAPVHTRIKADMQCLSVAAASVLAKVERDQVMRDPARRISGLRLGRQQGLRHVPAPGRHPGRRAVAPPPVSWRLLGGELQDAGLLPAGEAAAASAGDY